ncbi:MAG TPA: hypothetical protein VFQ61_27195 [Polyangiaceae bacterium]|nr:hypothetical protein [Polyangiaceae bacterium]
MASYNSIVAFAEQATPGDYLPEFDDTFAEWLGPVVSGWDPEIAECDRRLNQRGLAIEVDDRGLVARAWT